MKFFLVYLLIVNAAGFLSMLADKHKARKNHWRIPEATLLTIALLGGSLGSWIGMYTVRHKTRHWKFVLGIPAILLCQVMIFFWTLR